MFLYFVRLPGAHLLARVIMVFDEIVIEYTRGRTNRFLAVQHSVHFKWVFTFLHGRVDRRALRHVQSEQSGAGHTQQATKGDLDAELLDYRVASIGGMIRSVLGMYSKMNLRKVRR